MCPTGQGCGARSRFSAAFGASKTGAGGAFFALAAGAGFADFGVSAAVFSLAAECSLALGTHFRELWKVGEGTPWVHSKHLRLPHHDMTILNGVLYKLLLRLETVY